MATHLSRIDRLKALLGLIPGSGSAQFPGTAILQERAAPLYDQHRSDAARRRALQRDLEDLIASDDIEVVNPGGKPRRYRRRRPAIDARLWAYVRRSLRSIIDTHLPMRRFDVLWRQLLERENDLRLGLGDDKFRIVADSLRLQPAEINEAVLTDVLDALARSRTLRVSYRSAAGQLSRPTLHPQGLLERGPRLYLYALKNDEDDWRMYALHRIIRSEVGTEPARRLPGFDLQALIDDGAADFSSGELIRLELRVRGYVVELLRDCPLAEGQRIEEEAVDSRFEARVHVSLCASGQLLRWLLGLGDNVEVLAPPDLRRVMAAQTAKMAVLYAETH